jgi:hypothetical protein
MSAVSARCAAAFPHLATLFPGSPGTRLQYAMRELRFSDYIGDYAMSDDCACTVPDRTQHPPVRKAEFAGDQVLPNTGRTVSSLPLQGDDLGVQPQIGCSGVPDRPHPRQ